MRPRQATFLIAYFISVALHVIFFVCLGFSSFDEVSDGEISSYFEVTPWFPESDPRNPTEDEIEQDENHDPEDAVPDGNLVDTLHTENEQRPDNDRFLSERDQTVENETQARLTIPGAPSPETQIPIPFNEGNQAPFEPEQARPMLAGVMFQERGLRSTEEGELSADQAPPASPPSPIDLRPTIAAMSDAVGGTGSNYLLDSDGVAEGDRNLLSTARFLHAPFFQRVKRQVEQYWHPDVAFRQHDPGGHIYGYRDRETVIRVVLNEQGSLVRAYIINRSGAQFLDDEALEAIEQAAPFPNPPRGLVDPETNHIVFAFGFIVELSERPVFRLRRHQ